jgi:hypothetical protein
VSGTVAGTGTELLKTTKTLGSGCYGLESEAPARGRKGRIGRRRGKGDLQDDAGLRGPKRGRGAPTESGDRMRRCSAASAAEQGMRGGTMETAPASCWTNRHRRLVAKRAGGVMGNDRICP